MNRKDRSYYSAGDEPLVDIYMRLSATNEEYSASTINRIISASQKLGYDGWIVANVYPKRATNTSDLNVFNLELVTESISLILKVFYLELY